MDRKEVKTASDLVYFTQGFCFELAIELHKRTGFGLRVFYGSLADHALVQVPDGQYLDVRGLQTRQELRKHWGDGTLYAVKPGHFIEWEALAVEHLGGVDPKRLSRVTDRLLQNLVTLKCTECPATKMVEREDCFYDFKTVETICPACVKEPKKVKAHARRTRVTQKKSF